MKKIIIRALTLLLALTLVVVPLVSCTDKKLEMKIYISIVVAVHFSPTHSCQ